MKKNQYTKQRWAYIGILNLTNSGVCFETWFLIARLGPVQKACSISESNHSKIQDEKSYTGQSPVKIQT